MSMRTAIILGLLIPVGFAVTTAASAQSDQGPRPERPSYSELDLNEDGQLTLEELRAQGTARFEAADTNADGELDAQELTVQAQARASSRVEQMIERMDADGNGTLSAEEMTDRDSGRRGDRIFGRMDADDDGVVSEAEFEAAAERMRDHRGPRRG